MKTYNDLLEKIMGEGVDREGRNGWTRSLFAQQLRFDLRKGFPAVTTKKLAFKSVVGELLWFIEGSGDNNRLKEIMGTEKTIWSDNAESLFWKHKAHYLGDLGRIYGVQWRSWNANYAEHIDQLGEVIEKIKTNPTDRRLVVSAWNVGELDQMALPPCHMMFQLYPNTKDKLLSLHMVQRSCDMFLGVPFNIASYALLLEMISQVTGYTAHELVITLNDAHIYHEHFDAVVTQLSRTPYPLPSLKLNKEVLDIDDFKMPDIQLENYQFHQPILAKMIV